MPIAILGLVPCKFEFHIQGLLFDPKTLQAPIAKALNMKRKTCATKCPYEIQLLQEPWGLSEKVIVHM